MGNGQLNPTSFLNLENGVAPLSRAVFLNGAGGSKGQTDEIDWMAFHLTRQAATRLSCLGFRSTLLTSSR